MNLFEALMIFGDYTIDVKNAGLFRLDGGAMFGIVPKVLWQEKNPPDERNRISMCNNLALVRGKEKTILVDAGNSETIDEKFRDIYGLDNSRFSLNRFLSSLGVQYGDVTDVVLTHLHFDHSGGTVKKELNGTIVPAFPNATFYVQKKQYEWALKPSFKDKASFIKDNFVPLMEAGKLELLDGEGELFSGFELLTFDGHTPGQQLPLIHGDSTKFFFGGDLFPMKSHVSVPWVMAYDIEPLKSIAEKKSILQRAVDENWVILFEHDPNHPGGTIEKIEKAYGVKEEIFF